MSISDEVSSFFVILKSSIDLITPKPTVELMVEPSCPDTRGVFDKVSPTSCIEVISWSFVKLVGIFILFVVVSLSSGAIADNVVSV